MNRIFFALIFASKVWAGEVLDPNQAYTAEQKNAVTYEAEFDLVFTPPSGSQDVRVWLPVPPSNAAQKLANYRTDPKPDTDAAEPLYGNRLVSFHFEKPLGGQTIHQSFRITTHELFWHLDPDQAQVVSEWPTSFAPFLRSEDKIVVDESTRALAREIVGDEANPILQARKITDYVMASLNYSHTTCSLEASSKWALEKKTGHCSDYHGLTTALARSVGIPARVTYGVNPLPKSSPSHCKNEMFFAGYGWVSFDVSETQQFVKKIQADPSMSAQEREKKVAMVMDRFYSGYRDNTWYQSSSGTNFDFVPKTAAGTPPLVRTAYIEADGVPLKDPDPGNPEEKEFAWMTVVKFSPDQAVTYPFK